MWVKFLNLIDRTSLHFNVAAGISLLILALLTSLEVILRYVLNSPTTWGLEVSCYILLFVFFGSIAGALKEEQHIRATFIVSQFPVRIRKILKVITGYLCFFTTLIFLWQTTIYEIMRWLSGERSLNPLRTPLFIPTLIIPIGIFLFSLEWVVRLKEYTRGLNDRHEEDFSSEIL